MSLDPILALADILTERDALRQQVADLTAERDALRDAADIYVRRPTTKTLTDLRALIARVESETTT